MLPFEVELRNGPPVYEQIVLAAKKAILGGRMQPDDPFPSVRAISREVKVNPNTVQKVVAQLQREGFLDVRPGVGTVVRRPDRADPVARAALLGEDLEAVAVRARELGLTLEELTETLSTHWENLSHDT
jgi:GntR family transcriptional regulator